MGCNFDMDSCKFKLKTCILSTFCINKWAREIWGYISQAILVQGVAMGQSITLIKQTHFCLLIFKAKMDCLRATKIPGVYCKFISVRTKTDH